MSIEERIALAARGVVSSAMQDLPDIASIGRAVLDFWFVDLKPAQWWRTDPETDKVVARRFCALHEKLSREVGDAWLRGPDTALAAVIVLDQFSRNIYRGDPRAFAQDASARRVADAAISRKYDLELPPQRRAFIYMPFMHSEDAADQLRSLTLFESLGGDHVRHAREHKAVVDRFGRFPRRNGVLGRASTTDERAHLAKSGGPV